MTGRTLRTAALCIAFVAGMLVSNRLGVVEGQQKKTPGEGFAAVPGQKGGHDVFGPYDPVQNWPRPLSESLPNHESRTYSQATDVFPESIDRVFATTKGELPVLPSGRGSAIGPRAEVRAAQGRQPGIPGREAVARGLVKRMSAGR